jgi:hypothetical protein
MSFKRSSIIGFAGINKEPIKVISLFTFIFHKIQNSTQYSSAAYMLKYTRHYSFREFSANCRELFRTS